MSQSNQYVNLIVGVCDINGLLRGKRLAAASLEKVLKEGIRMPTSSCSVDIWGNDIEGSPLVMASGDQDGVCLATSRGAVPLDWSDRPTALIPVTMHDNSGVPYLGDPRNALAEVLSKYTELGLTPVVATELEFYLVDNSGPRPTPPNSRQLDFSQNDVLSLDAIADNSKFLDALYDSCMLQNIPADAVISEGGAGQFEVNLDHQDDALKAADDALYFKRAVKGIAQKHGMAATFMAKPYTNRAGNGFHMHFSLLDQDGNNVFDDGTEGGSDLMKSAIAGLLASMEESTLIFAPHYNSYRRFAENTHAPTGISWGYENRTAAIRIPGGPHQARRIEHRVAGGDTNPYLVLAAVLGGALHGIKNKLSPMPPVFGNAFEQSETFMPTNWQAAIDTFCEGKILPTIFSDQMIENFRSCKQQELNGIFRQVTDREFASYLETV
ncbi:glutamine synthetase family protein [Maritalea sp.]|uniref:glutamine synthetase family protein n=1 Tax=Maritalea sp. TaxID=2003361 RepID=UPI0039E238FC